MSSQLQNREIALFRVFISPSYQRAVFAILSNFVTCRSRIMAEKPKVDLGLLEEDDEFEEFPAENWGTEDADDEDVSVWEDNWEDDIVQDDFSQQLRQQMEKLKETNKV